MSSGTPPRDRSRPPQNREALEKLEDPRTPDRGRTEVRDHAKSAEATSYVAGQCLHAPYSRGPLAQTAPAKVVRNGEAVMRRRVCSCSLAIPGSCPSSSEARHHLHRCCRRQPRPPTARRNWPPQHTVEAVEAFRNHHMSSGTPPRDRSRPPQNREALENPRPPPGGGTLYAP